MVKRFRKKPVVIEAIRWTGKNRNEIDSFLGITTDPNFANHGYAEDGTLLIKTLESGHGMHTARKGDMIIRGVDGEFYPCKMSIFKKTYEEVK